MIKKNRSTNIKIFDIISKNFKNKTTSAFIFFFIIIIIFGLPLRINQNTSDVKIELLLPTNIKFKSYFIFYKKHFDIDIQKFKSEEQPAAIFKSFFLKNLQKKKQLVHLESINFTSETGFISNINMKFEFKKNQTNKIFIEKIMKPIIQESIEDFSNYYRVSNINNDDLTLEKDFKEAEKSLEAFYNELIINIHIEKSKLSIIEYFILILISIVLFFIILLLKNFKTFSKN